MCELIDTGHGDFSLHLTPHENLMLNNLSANLCKAPQTILEGELTYVCHKICSMAQGVLLSDERDK